MRSVLMLLASYQQELTVIISVLVLKIAAMRILDDLDRSCIRHENDFLMYVLETHWLDRATCYALRFMYCYYCEDNSTPLLSSSGLLFTVM